VVFPPKKTVECVIAEMDQVDLSRANYTAELSSIGIDEVKEHFHVTWDRASFHKPLDIISKVLDANGYALNFENLIACLDSAILGARVRVSDDEHIPRKAKAFIPCFSFEMPKKNRIGFLLKKFYKEIEHYESELARIREGDPAHPGKANREHIKQEIERLQRENAQLTSRLQELTSRLAESVRSQAHVTKALEKQNIIPPGLKSGVVRDLSLVERTVTLKAGRTHYTIPLVLLLEIPKPGEPCLIKFKDDTVTNIYCYEQQGRPFHQEIGEVLFVGEKSCKIRDSHRKNILWQALNDSEIQQLRTLKRGNKVILYSIDDIAIKISLVLDPDAERIKSGVQEKIALFQLEQSRQINFSDVETSNGKGS
jgi:hypothetical protein